MPSTPTPSRRCPATSLALWAWLVAGACTGDDRPPGQEFAVVLGSDYTTSPALGPDGSVYVGVFGSGVSYHEFTLPATGQVFRGVSSESRAGRLVKLTRKGKVQWQVGLPERVGPPVVTRSGLVVVGSGHYTYAFDPDGELVWRAPCAGQASEGADGTLYIAGAESLFAVSPDGVAVVDFAADPALAGRYFDQPPAIGPDGTLYLASRVVSGAVDPAPRLHALSPAGEVRWSVEAGTRANDGEVLVAADGVVCLNENALEPEPTHVRGFHPDGTSAFVVSGHRAEAAVGDHYVGRADHAMEAFDREGRVLWSYPTGRAIGAPAIDEAGRVCFAENTRQDDLHGTADFYFDVLDADGKLVARHPIDGNTYEPPPVLAAGGRALQSAIWANQYPPFDAKVLGIHADVSKLSTTGWPRLGGDDANTRRAPFQVARVPGAEDVRGLWLNEDGDAPSALRFGTPEILWPDIANADLPYQIWHTRDGRASEVERGGAAVVGDSVRFTPSWSAQAALPAAYSRPLAASPAHELVLGDPLGSGATLTLVRGLRRPELGEFDAAGRVLWARSENGAAETSAGSSDGEVFVAGRYGFHPDLTLGGVRAPLPAPDHAGTARVRFSADGEETMAIAKTDEGDWSERTALRARVARDGTTVVLVQPVLPDNHGNVQVYGREIWTGDQMEVGVLAMRPGGDMLATDMALLSDGGFAVLGMFRGVVELDSGMKLDAGGAGTRTLWAVVKRSGETSVVTWPAHDYDQALAIDAAADGRLRVAASRQDGATAPRRLVVQQLDRDDKIEREHEIPLGPGVSYGPIAFGPNGDLAVAVQFEGDVTLGGQTFSATPDVADGGLDAIVAWLDADGAVRWARQIGGVDAQMVQALAFDGRGHLVVGGWLGATINDDGPEAPYLQAYDVCGRPLWSRAVSWCDGCGHATLNVLSGRVEEARSGHVDVNAIHALANGELRVVVTPSVPFEVDGQLIASPLPETGGGRAGNFTVLALSATAAATTEPAECPAPLHQIAVTITGTGEGRVVSDPPGIDCPGACVATFAGLAPVHLRAEPEPGSGLSSWSGACSGRAACDIVSTADRRVTAQFDRPVVIGAAGLGWAPTEVAGSSIDDGHAVLVSNILDRDSASVPASVGYHAGVGASGIVVSHVAATGVTDWSLAIQHPVSITAKGAVTGADGATLIAATPGGAGDLVVSGAAGPASGPGGLLLLRVDRDGALDWARAFPEVVSAPIVASPIGGGIVCGVGAFDADGAPTWRFPANAAPWITCGAISDGGAIAAHLAKPGAVDQSVELGRFDASGGLMWSRDLGGAVDVRAVAWGEGQGPSVFGFFGIGGASQIFGHSVAGPALLQLDTSGGFVAARALDGFPTDWSSTVALDGTGLAVLVPGPSAVPGVMPDAVDIVLRYGSDGAFEWARALLLPGTSINLGRIAMDSSGNVIATDIARPSFTPDLGVAPPLNSGPQALFAIFGR